LSTSLVKNSPFNSSFLQEQTEIFRFKLVKKLLYFLLSYFTTRKKSGVREGTFFNTTAKNHFQLMIFQPIPGFHLLIPFASQLDVWVSDEFSDRQKIFYSFFFFHHIAGNFRVLNSFQENLISISII
jgi:hypothetical protein